MYTCENKAWNSLTIASIVQLSLVELALVLQSGDLNALLVDQWS